MTLSFVCTITGPLPDHLFDAYIHGLCSGPSHMPSMVTPTTQTDSWRKFGGSGRPFPIATPPSSLHNSSGTCGGPELLAIDIGRNGWSEAYSPTWKQLAAILGTAVPFWYRLLRDPDTIKAWRPGSPTAIVPAFDPELPTEPFTALAADEPDGSPVIPLCLWLARTIRDRWTDDAWEKFFNQLREIPDDGAPRWTHAAFPLELQRPEAEPPRGNPP